MTTRKEVQTLCDGLGIGIDDTSESKYFDVRFDAPQGKKFACRDVHCLSEFQYKGFGKKAVSDYWEAIKSDIEFGITDCNDPDCDVCDEPAQ